MHIIKLFAKVSAGTSAVSMFGFSLLFFLSIFIDRDNPKVKLFAFISGNLCITAGVKLLEIMDSYE